MAKSVLAYVECIEKSKVPHTLAVKWRMSVGFAMKFLADWFVSHCYGFFLIPVYNDTCIDWWISGYSSSLCFLLCDCET